MASTFNFKNAFIEDELALILKHLRRRSNFKAYNLNEMFNFFGED